MKGERLVIAALTVAALTATVALVVVLSEGAGPRREKTHDVLSVARTKVSAVEQERKEERIGNLADKASRLPDLKCDIAKKTEQSVSVDDATDDALLKNVVAELMDELGKASAKKDIKSVLALIDKLRSINFGAVSGSRGGGSLAIKRRVLQELEAAGVAGVSQVIDMLNDSEPDIAQSASELLFKTLQDLSLGDYARAEIVTAAAESLTDNIALDKLFGEFMKMRPSVCGKVLADISKSGTPEAKAKLPRQISVLASDPTVTTVDQLTEDHLQDPEYADRLYGGIILGGETK